MNIIKILGGHRVLGGEIKSQTVCTITTCPVSGKIPFANSEGVCRTWGQSPAFSLPVSGDGDVAVGIHFGDCVGVVLRPCALDRRLQCIVVNPGNMAVAARMVMALEDGEHFTRGIQNAADLAEPPLLKGV